MVDCRKLGGIQVRPKISLNATDGLDIQQTNEAKNTARVSTRFKFNISVGTISFRVLHSPHIYVIVQLYSKEEKKNVNSVSLDIEIQSD